MVADDNVLAIPRARIVPEPMEHILGRAFARHCRHLCPVLTQMVQIGGLAPPPERMLCCCCGVGSVGVVVPAFRVMTCQKDPFSDIQDTSVEILE